VPSLRIALLAVVSLLLAAPTARGSDNPKELADAVASQIVHVDERAKGRVSQREAGDLRLRITRRDVGRIKILVVPPETAERNGGLVSLTSTVAKMIDLRGALLTVAGPDVRVTTSYDSGPAVTAVQEAMSGRFKKRIAGDLEEAVDALARVDPGAEAEGPAPGDLGDIGEEANDFLDDIGDTLKTVLFAFIAIVAFLVLVPFLIWGYRARRRRADDQEGLQIAREKARQDLVDVGGTLRELDAVDVDAPGIDPAGRDALSRALELYDQADRELKRANTRRRVDQARTTLNTAISQATIARRRLMGESSQAPSSPGGSGFVNP
jgi:hypothetical protein